MAVGFWWLDRGIERVEHVAGVSLHGIQVRRVSAGERRVLRGGARFSHGDRKQRLAARRVAEAVHDVADVNTGGPGRNGDLLVGARRKLPRRGDARELRDGVVECMTCSRIRADQKGLSAVTRVGHPAVVQNLLDLLVQLLLKPFLRRGGLVARLRQLRVDRVVGDADGDVNFGERRDLIFPQHRGRRLCRRLRRNGGRDANHDESDDRANETAG